MRSPYTYSEELVDYIASEAVEGFRSVAYWDKYGKCWTIGHGETLGVKQGDTITREQARIQLRKRLDGFAKEVNFMLLNCPVLTQGQFSALVDLAYNMGSHRVGGSDVMINLRNGKMHEAAKAFEEYVYSGGVKLGGLVKRRKTEETWFEEK